MEQLRPIINAYRQGAKMSSLRNAIKDSNWMIVTFAFENGDVSIPHFVTIEDFDEYRCKCYPGYIVNQMALTSHNIRLAIEDVINNG